MIGRGMESERDKQREWTQLVETTLQGTRATTTRNRGLLSKP